MLVLELARRQQIGCESFKYIEYPGDKLTRTAGQDSPWQRLSSALIDHLYKGARLLVIVINKNFYLSTLPHFG
jgi:hypothetical protein